MSGLRSYILDEDTESPATLHSSPPPPSRRHQQQQQQQQQQASNAPRTTAASAAYPRLRALYLHSDADASSDFSELELHRPIPSSSGGEGGLGDFSDYETPLPGRWDLAAHWHMGEYYSEGVEGDADDDDDEDRDLDTDLSEGPTPGPGLRASRWTGGSDRGMQLDMGRVRDILSSPISAPIALNNTGLSSRNTTSDSVTTAGPSASISTGVGGSESMFSGNLIDSIADIGSFSSSTSEDILSSHHHHQHRAYQPHTNASERSVRFSRDAAPPPTRAFQTPQLTADINASTPTLEPMTPEIFTPASDSTIGTNTHDVDDNMQSTRSLTEIFGGTLGSLNQYRPSTRPQGQASSSTGQDSSLGGGFDHSGHTRVYSPSRLTDFTGQGSSRSQFVRYPLPPGGGNGQSRLAGGSGGGGNSSLQQPQHHHLFALAASNRHGLVSSPRGHLSPYWGALERSRRHGSQSPRYSSTTSPNSSASSSRIGSPLLDPQSAVLKSQESEGSENVLIMTEQQDEGHRLNQPTTCNTPFTGAGEGRESRQFCGISRRQQGVSRLGSSIFAANNEQNITSLPSFASSVFMPVIQGTTLIPCETYGPSRMYRRPKTNHPRRPCCFLQAGQRFSGSQSLKTMTSTLSGMRARQVEEWNVKVSISAVDYYAGTVCGHMEAMDVPMSVSNVVTFWEGEIIDFDNHTLWTRKWAAKEKTDLDHWRRLEAFRGMEEKHIIKGAENGRFKGQITQKYIFMRWKERHFVNVSEHTSGLTIAGFYYVSMRRSDGLRTKSVFLSTLLSHSSFLCSFLASYFFSWAVGNR